MKKLMFVLAVITAFVLSSCKENDYKVIVDYNLSFNQMIKAGKYDSVKNVSEWHYQIPHDKRGIKVFSKNEYFLSNKPDSLQPEEIDKLLVIMDSLEREKWQEYKTKYGSITPEDLNSGKFDDLKLRRCTVQYKKPDVDTLTMRLFEKNESMEKAGYRSATAHEAMFFAGKYPYMQKKFDIVAFGSVWKEHRGLVADGWNDFISTYTDHVVILTGNNFMRKLSTVISRDSHNWMGEYVYHQWNLKTRFLVVKKKP